MSTTTTKQKFRTLDSALTRIEELETAGDDSNLKAQITSLTAELAAKTAENKLLKAAFAGQQSAPSGTSPLPATKPIESMELSELIAACDSAAAAGDKSEANRFYRAYTERKANR
jgi:hypothetical protein